MSKDLKEILRQSFPFQHQVLSAVTLVQSSLGADFSALLEAESVGCRFDLGTELQMDFGADGFAEAEGIRLVIRGAAEGGRHAEALAAADIAVILNPLVYGPGSFDQREARPDNAQLLQEAGVDVIISTTSAHFARSLRQLAGNAVRGGMDHTAAVRAITSTPAAVFGLNDRGEIARGAYANLVVWSGDPLEIETRVEGLFIGGQAVELTSRQTELFDRYRERPGSPVPALSLPGTDPVPAAE